MNRFFIARTVEMPTLGDQMGNWHMIDLGSHGSAGAGHCLVCLHDSNIPPKSGWAAFPRLTDHVTPIKAAIDATLLADVGLTGNETAADAVDVLNLINPMFLHA
jgi:hypothetical protein